MKKITLSVSFKETNPFLGDAKKETPSIQANQSTVTQTPVESTEDKVVKEENKQEAEIVGVPMSVLKSFMQIAERLANDNNAKTVDSTLLAEAISKALSSKNERRGLVSSMAYTKETLPLEDILEKPVMFFAFCAATVIYDDVVKGLTVNAPHNPIKFTPFLRYVQPGTKGKVVTQCMAYVWSKSQAEFVRNHSLFGIQYFERLDSSTTYSNDLIDKVVSSYTKVSQYNEFQVKQKCMELNIKVDTNDFNTLRKRIAHKMAEELQKHESQLRLSDVQDTEISQQIRNKESGVASKAYS